MENLHVSNASIETCTIKLKFNKFSYHAIGKYRPCSGSVKDFIAELVILFPRVRGFGHHNVIMLGDSNAERQISIIV